LSYGFLSQTFSFLAPILPPLTKTLFNTDSQLFPLIGGSPSFRYSKKRTFFIFSSSPFLPLKFSFFFQLFQGPKGIRAHPAGVPLTPTPFGIYQWKPSPSRMQTPFAVPRFTLFPPLPVRHNWRPSPYVCPAHTSFYKVALDPFALLFPTPAGSCPFPPFSPSQRPNSISMISPNPVLFLHPQKWTPGAKTQEFPPHTTFFPPFFFHAPPTVCQPCGTIPIALLASSCTPAIFFLKGGDFSLFRVRTPPASFPPHLIC